MPKKKQKRTLNYNAELYTLIEQHSKIQYDFDNDENWCFANLLQLKNTNSSAIIIHWRKYSHPTYSGDDVQYNERTYTLQLNVPDSKWNGENGCLYDDEGNLIHSRNYNFCQKRQNDKEQDARQNLQQQQEQQLHSQNCVNDFVCLVMRNTNAAAVAGINGKSHSQLPNCMKVFKMIERYHDQPITFLDFIRCNKIPRKEKQECIKIMAMLIAKKVKQDKGIDYIIQLVERIRTKNSGVLFN